MDSVKFCQIPLKVFKDSLDFYIDLVKFFQMLSDSSLFSNGRFELQLRANCGRRHMPFIIGVQNAVTDLWRIVEKFDEVDVKIWQNMTKFDRVAAEFPNRIFHHWNMDFVKFC